MQYNQQSFIMRESAIQRLPPSDSTQRVPFSKQKTIRWTGTEASSHEEKLLQRVVDSTGNVQSLRGQMTKQRSSLNIFTKRSDGDGSNDHQDVDFPGSTKKSWTIKDFIQKLNCLRVDESSNLDDYERMQKRSNVSFHKRLSTTVPRKSVVQISEKSRMQRLVIEIKESLFNLGCSQTSDKEVEEWSCLIYESMSAASRTFHGVQHVFDVSEGKDEVQTLCAFFHDCIYYNIDNGLSSSQKERIGNVIEEKEGDVFITEAELGMQTKMVTDIFGFTKGQKLNPFSGLNEYLSAVLAVRCLCSSPLRLRHLAEIATCIEATIPFRAGDPMEDLYCRLKEVNQMYRLGMTEDEVVFAVQRACDFANTDVLNFSLESKALFLSNTWNLLPESNISLRNASLFRVSEYASALEKMVGFFSFLRAETIFSSFRNVPSDKVLAELTRKAGENIDFALKYMNCKRLSVSVLVAFAELTGGDAPISMFLGDLPDANYISPSVEDLIITGKRKKDIILDVRVLSLLKDGREMESNFDIKNSPISAFLYNSIGDAGVGEALKYAKGPMDAINSKALLMSLPKDCVIDIGSACSVIAITRSDGLRNIIDKIIANESL